MAAAHEAGIGRLVLVSSFAVYDVAALPPGGHLDEQTPLAAPDDPRGPYIAAKLAQEAIVRAAGLDWRIVRPGLVFGPERMWFYHLGLHLHRRLWLSLAGDATLPLTWIDNCADAVVAALETDSSGCTVNVVDDDLPTRSAYLAALGRHSRPSPVVLDLPWGLLVPAPVSPMRSNHPRHAASGASRGAMSAAHVLKRGSEGARLGAPGYDGRGAYAVHGGLVTLQAPGDHFVGNEVSGSRR